MDEVRLPDLEVIRRFSIAVRRERAPVEEVVEALKADLETIMRARGGPSRAAKPAAVPKSAAAAKPATARKTAARAPARKAARRR